MVKDEPIDDVASVPREADILVITGLLVTAFGCWMANSREADVFPRWPFVWREVAVAYFLCALPAARWLGGLVVSWTNSLIAGFGATAVLTAVWWGTLSLSQDSPLLDASLLSMIAIRAGLAVVVATAALVLSRGAYRLGCRSFLRSAPASGPKLRWRRIPLLANLLFVALVPAAFMQSRSTEAQSKLAESLSKSRLGQARRLATQLRVSSPGLTFGKDPIQQVTLELDDRVRRIERQVSMPLPDTATVTERLERARLVVILGRVGEAQQILISLINTESPHPPSCLLLGTAYEWAEDWPTSLGWYLKAREGLLPGRESPAARPLLLQAIKGVAYTQRKQGHLPEAEVAYREALELSPTAGMHFLLAQFYEDGQQSAKALQHVRTAMEMDRQRFDSPGRDLIDKLVTQHFGCLSIFKHSNRE